MFDRLMQRMDRHFFSRQYFHGSSDTAELNIRGWVLIYNFTPSNPMTIKKYQGKNVQQTDLMALPIARIG